MKKIKFLTPLMATVAAVTPAMATLTSCGRVDLAEIASEIKDTTISNFIEMCKKTHRDVWDEEEAFNYVVNTMQDLGFTEYAGRDYWSEIPTVENEIYAKTGKKVGERGYPDYGNVWYDIPATDGYEDAPKVILQSHLDSQMAFASEEAEANWKKNGINVTFDNDNDILSTDQKTSLGADGGIGTALLLALVKHRNKFPHGAWRLIFTAGESEATVASGEEGKEGYIPDFPAGASFLLNDQTKKLGGYLTAEDAAQGGKCYLEKDSLPPFGETNEFKYFITCGGTNKNGIYRSTAGIHECEIHDEALKLNATKSSIPSGFTNSDTYVNELLSSIEYENEEEGYPKASYPMHLYSVSLEGLHGGHSATDINKTYANALMMMMKLVWYDKQLSQIVSASSLPGAYAIASSAKCVFTSSRNLSQLTDLRDRIIAAAKESCPVEDWDNIKFEITQLDDGLIGKGDYKYGLSAWQSRHFAQLIGDELSFGPVEWFDEAKQNVKTSLNHGALTLKVDQTGNSNSVVEFHVVVRSADEDRLVQCKQEGHELYTNHLKYLYPFDDNPSEGDKDKLNEHVTHIENPVWEAKEDNKLVSLLEKGYKNIGIKANIIDNHGWVEAGSIAEVYTTLQKDMDPEEWKKYVGEDEPAWADGWEIASIGPQINSNHEVDETCYTDTLKSLNKSLIYTLMNIKDIA